jgi:hypothetical protein
MHDWGEVVAENGSSTLRFGAAMTASIRATTRDGDNLIKGRNQNRTLIFVLTKPCQKLPSTTSTKKYHSERPKHEPPPARLLHNTTIHPKRLHRRVGNTSHRPRPKRLACSPRAVWLGVDVDDAVYVSVDADGGGWDRQCGASPCAGSLEPAECILADAHVDTVGLEGPVGSVAESEGVWCRCDGDGDGRDGEWESHFGRRSVLSGRRR